MTARESLKELLDLILGAEDLRRFAEAELGQSGTAIGSEHRAAALVEALELRGGIDDGFFDRLRAAFPARVADIEQVARQWLPDRASGPDRPAPPRRPAPSARPEDGTWDLFLAHAGPDGAAADQLYEVLTEAGLLVFLDSRCLQLGERWDDVIPAALDAARRVVVLISTRTRDAYYAREEIAMAIDANRRRGGSRGVIPVYLDRMPEAPADWLYGLRRLQGMVAAEVGWPRGVAERILAAFDRDDDDAAPPRPDEPASTDAAATSPEPRGADPAPLPPAPPPTTCLHYLHLAMDLDRSEQWLALLRECRSDRGGIYLLYGERRQNLELFVARLWHYLAEETDRHHRIIQVPERLEGELPRTGAAWEINLRYALPAGRGTAADLLAEVARHGPVFLLIGKHPLSRDALDEDEEAIGALEEFLEERLPRLIKDCHGPHPVRALLATDYERLEASLEARLQAKLQRGARRFGVRCRRLPEVEHVQWGHIKGYLDGLDPPPPAQVYDALEREYARLDHGHISFRDLAERLSRRL